MMEWKSTPMYSYLLAILIIFILLEINRRAKNPPND